MAESDRGEPASNTLAKSIRIARLHGGSGTPVLLPGNPTSPILLRVVNHGKGAGMTTITSISMPDQLRTALDEEAERQRRSRSFVVAEAVREYLARRQGDAFDEARLRTLRDGLSLTPGDRIELAEELWLEFAHGRPTSEPWTATFETFDEYERWRREREDA